MRGRGKRRNEGRKEEGEEKNLIKPMFKHESNCTKICVKKKVDIFIFF